MLTGLYRNFVYNETFIESNEDGIWSPVSFKIEQVAEYDWPKISIFIDREQNISHLYYI